MYVSHVTIWQYECALNCNGPRGRQVTQGRGRTAPDTDWVNGPNQLWDWDITFLHTRESRTFLYLYSLLDHWSRKNVAWRISPQLISAEVQTLWDHGLIDEGLLDQPAHTWPKSLSDRGVQMRSHSTAIYFQKLGIPQLFSRPVCRQAGRARPMTTRTSSRTSPPSKPSRPFRATLPTKSKPKVISL